MIFSTSKGKIVVGITLMTLVGLGGTLLLFSLRGPVELSNNPPQTQQQTQIRQQPPSDKSSSSNQGVSPKSTEQSKKSSQSAPSPQKAPGSGGTTTTVPPTTPPSGGSTTPSTPTVPPQNGGCTGSAWTPGGPDPWGGCWPGPGTTGVPAGVVLTNYAESCTITQANTVIDAKIVNCILSIRANNVKITRSQINGGVDVPSAAPADASFSISDSSIFIGDNLNTGLMQRNFTANRVNIMGGRRSVYCANNCLVENSWVHAQGGDPNGAAHFSGMRMEQFTTYRHNSITCEATRVPGSGCSAGLTGYGDFAPIQNNLIERNLFYRGGVGGSTTCAYGGSSGDDGSKPYGNQAMNIQFISNRFVRSDNGLCGNLRTIIDFSPLRPGNIWTDNLYNDGAAVNPTGP